MNYVSTTSGVLEFSYTFSPKLLGFTPNRFIFNDVDNASNPWRTDDLSYNSMQPNNTYTFTQTPVSASNGITIKFPSSSSSSKYNLYLWDSNSHYKNVEPMGNYDSSKKEFSYTLSYSSPYWKPTGIKFQDAAGGNWNTGDMSITTDYGYTYRYFNGDSIKMKPIYYGTWGTPSSLSEDINTTHYVNPLYFGCFYISNDAKKYIRTPQKISNSFKNTYNNFFWQANIGMKSITGETYETRGATAVQGLVDDDLPVNGKPTQSGRTLPYFDSSSTWSAYINSYEDSAMAFPFYETLFDATKVKGTGAAGTDQKAKFYQFNSSDANLYFNGSKFVESDQVIKSREVNQSRTPGFYPFNNSDSTTNNGEKNNLGFGTVFEVSFKLTEDGYVDAVAEDGDAIETGARKLNTMFEFYGDDDVWVYIDNHLVLDLGGAHYKSAGVIDFTARTATAGKAVTIGAGNGRQDLGAAYTTNKQKTDIHKLLRGTNTALTYDTTVTHTMKVFYMERGMGDSNLLIRYNFNAVSNFNTMKVREVTNFTYVNDGLVDITRRAADKDVFKYTMSNQGTSKGDIKSSGILAPPFDYYERRNTETDQSSVNTKLTGVTIDKNIYFDISSVTGWISSSRYLKAFVWKDSAGKSSGKIYSYSSEDGNIYTFNNFPSDADKVIFMRCKNNLSDGSGWPGEPGGNNVANALPEADFVAGDVFGPTDGGQWNVGGWLRNVNPIDPTVSIKNFLDNVASPNAATDYPVANVNYIWKTAFSTYVSGDDDIDGMTGTTTSPDGSFYLLYGKTGTDTESTKVESSAEFRRQFSTDSVMTVTQNSTLYKASNPETSPASFEVGTYTSGGSQTNRSLARYYTTTKTIKDESDRDVTTTGANSFRYANNASTNADYVKITETFFNETNVGAISIEKELVNPSEPKENFEFKLTLTKVLEQDGVNVTDYSGIKSRLDTGSTLGTITDTNISNVDGEDAGTFTLQPGQKLTIYGIPVGTNYSIEETETDNYKKKTATNASGTVEQGSLTGSNTTYEPGNYTPKPSNVSVFTNERRTGKLTLSKTVYGANNAQSQDIDNNKEFTLHVVLNAPNDGLKLTHYLTNPPTISSTGTIASGTYTDSKYDFYVKVKPTDANKVEIDGIPFGTTYAVTEVYYNGSTYEEIANDPNHEYTYTIDNNTYGDEIKSASVVVNVTNVYRKVEMEKKDTKDTNKFVQGAKYVLVKLKSSAYSGTTLTDAAISAFNSATESNYTTTLTDYIEDYSGIIVSGSRQNGVLETNASGHVEVNDSMMTNGLRPGTYFFLELSSPKYYKKNNDSSVNYKDGDSTATEYKVFTISSNNPTQDSETVVERDYYDDREVGDLVLDKAFVSGTPDTYNNTTFTFHVVLDGTDVDGTGNHLDLSKYGITGIPAGTSYANNKYEFDVSIKVNDSTNTTIGNIPYGTKYTVTETGTGGSVSHTLKNCDNTIIDESTTATITNNFFTDPIPIDVDKSDKNDPTKKLANAEMELWYKETTTPDTFSPNDPLSIPNQLNGMKVSKSTTDVGVPGLQVTTEKTKTYTYTTSYSNPSVPSSSDEDWILPRSDSDYIYFRDYNVGTPGEHDSASYNDQGKNNANTNNGQKRSWRTTNFAKIKAASGNDPGTHGQDLELDYDESYWFAAEFYGSGKKTVKYAMWERFVDKYNSNTITTVWKIQPPDGYTQVRFILLKGDNWIRSTEKFTYKLGEIYHKES